MTDIDKDNIERTIADLELIQAAYPEEVVLHDNGHEATIHLSHDTWVSLTFPTGYPTTRPVEIRSYRSHEKNRINRVVADIRTIAQNSVPEESGMACCAMALESWNQEQQQQQQQTKVLIATLLFVVVVVVVLGSMIPRPWHNMPYLILLVQKIGRASCRERV